MSRPTPSSVGSLMPTVNGVLRFPMTSRHLQGGAIFLDRDGVINRRIPDGYVTRLGEFEFLPDAIPGIRALSGLGRPIIVVSNQAGVAKGLVAVRTLELITTWFVDEIVAGGGRIDAVYYCPHAPADNCECRKPKPGLLLQAAEDFGVDLGQSALIGDSVSDAEAAASAGVRALLLEHDLLAPKDSPAKAYETVSDLRTAAAAIKAV
ncbi:MAG TPA: HAD family hydrolase [Gemmatimonadaceae bacterium]